MSKAASTSAASPPAITWLPSAAASRRRATSSTRRAAASGACQQGRLGAPQCRRQHEERAVLACHPRGSRELLSTGRALRPPKGTSFDPGYQTRFAGPPFLRLVHRLPSPCLAPAALRLITATAFRATAGGHVFPCTTLGCTPGCAEPACGTPLAWVGPAPLQAQWPALGPPAC